MSEYKLKYAHKNFHHKQDKMYLLQNDKPSFLHPIDKNREIPKTSTTVKPKPFEIDQKKYSVFLLISIKGINMPSFIKI